MIKIAVALMAIAIGGCQAASTLSPAPATPLPTPTSTSADHPFEGKWRISGIGFSEVHVEIIESKVVSWGWQNLSFSAGDGRALNSSTVAESQGRVLLNWTDQLFFDDDAPMLLSGIFWGPDTSCTPRPWLPAGPLGGGAG